MRIFLWELKKALSTSVIWGFLAVCLLFNVILVISNTYNRNYIQYISGAVAQYGQKVDDEFIEKLKDAPASDERDRLLMSLGVSPDDEALFSNGSSQPEEPAQNPLQGIDTADYAEAYVKKLGLTGFWADLMEAKYDALQPVVDRLAAEEADKDLYAGEVTNDLHRQLFEILFRAVLTEGMLAAFLCMLLVLGAENLHGTDSLVFSTKRGREIVRPKIGVGFLCGIGSYILLAGGTLLVYFLIFDFSGIWNASVSSQFHTLADDVMTRPFFTWGGFTVLEYLWMQLALGALLVAVFCMLGAFAGLLFRNTYAAFVAVLAAGFLLLLLPGWFHSLNWAGGAFAAGLSPFWIWNIQGSWFTDLGGNALWPWWEITGVIISLVLLCGLLFAAGHWHRRKDLV